MLCCCLVTKSFLILLQPHGLQPARLIYLWDFSGKNTGVGCHFLPQGIFPTQELSPCLLHWQADSLSLRHQGSPQTVNRHMKRHSPSLVIRITQSKTTSHPLGWLESKKKKKIERTGFVEDVEPLYIADENEKW